MSTVSLIFFFFFQAEDGIRDIGVTGVQTCALPILGKENSPMSKAKLKCPRCHSHKLNKFGKDKAGNQKYQCKERKRQFTPSTTWKERQLKNYPRCPVCNKGTFIHHNYSNYINYRCNDKNSKYYANCHTPIGDEFIIRKKCIWNTCKS